MDNKWMATSKCYRFLPPRQRNVGDCFLNASLWNISWFIPQMHFGKEIFKGEGQGFYIHIYIY